MKEIYILDLIGTFAFAFYGGYVGLKKGLDILGISICAFLTAVGGGTLREIILNHKLFYFSDYNYLAAIVFGILLSLLVYKKFDKVKIWVVTLDAIGLVTFAFIGASKAHNADLGFFAMIFFALISSVGGGILRDIMLGEISEILHKGFYASVAIFLAIAYRLLQSKIDNYFYINLLLLICFSLRMIAVYYRINLWSPFRGMAKATTKNPA